jgi:acetyl-CoA carboxylase biotin carboxyl carrier protein
MKKTTRSASPKPTPKVVSKKNVKAPTKAATAAAAKVQSENLDLAQIKELIELISEKQFTEFELERGSFRMRLGRGTTTKVITETSQVLSNPLPIGIQAPSVVESVVVTPPPVAATPVSAVVPEPEETLHIITSPIVGTFYHAASPTAEPFIKVGDSISVGKVLCIVEAMKLMNEIQADVSGKVAKILVENGQPVEYGQPLFGIKL